MRPMRTGTSTRRRSSSRRADHLSTTRCVRAGFELRAAAAHRARPTFADGADFSGGSSSSLGTQPQVRSLAQRTCARVIEARPPLSGLAARFSECRPARGARRDARKRHSTRAGAPPPPSPLSCRSSSSRQHLSFTPAAADATIRSVMRIVELGHPLLTRCAAEVIASCAARPATPLSAPTGDHDGLLLHCSPASGGGAPTARLTLSGCADRAALLDACCAAATALLPRDKSACVARLLPLCRALLREIRARDGTRAREGPDIPPEAGGTGLGDQLCELLRCCAHPQLPSKSAMAVAEALGECLSSDCRHAWTSVLEARAQHPT